MQFGFVLYVFSITVNEISPNHVKCVKKYIFFKTSLPLATSVPQCLMEDGATAQLAVMFECATAIAVKTVCNCF